MTDWSAFKVLGMDIQGLEDFIVSNNLLPLGALLYILFCTSRYGWGWKNFIEEANTGEGIKFPASKVYRVYLTYVLPIIIAFIMIMAYVTLFK